MAKRLKTPAKGYEEYTVQPILDRAFRLYIKKYGEHAPLPDTAPELGKRYVHFFQKEKRLCRFNLFSSAFDQESREVKNALLVKEATKRYLRKYGKSQIYPNGSPIVKGIFVYLQNDLKPLCRYNIHSHKIDVAQRVVAAINPRVGMGFTNSQLANIEEQLKQELIRRGS